MTREEAIEQLKGVRRCYIYITPNPNLEAIDMAIEALRNEINCVKCVHYTERETYTGIKGVCKMDTAHREDLISRQSALDALSEAYEDNVLNVWEDIEITIKSLPSADAVEVVRCKDCETIDENGWCEFVNGYVHDGFCAWGKHKGGDSE